MNNVVSRIRFSSFVVAQQYYIHQKILYYYKKRIGAERTPGVENEQPQIDRPTGWHGGSKFISPPFLLLFLQMIPKSCALMAKYTADRFQWEVR